MLFYNSIRESSDERNQETFDRKVLLSKMKGLNSYLSSLLQKRIRIDLEIKRTRQRLSKLKSRSMTHVKTRVELEGLNYDSLTSKDLSILQEKVGKEDYQELYQLDKEVYEADRILTIYADLPLFEE